MDSYGTQNMSMMKNMAEITPKSSLRKDIDENLKRIYEDALNEEVPDRFKLLLAQLKAKAGDK
jgi:hypothetical protein